MPVFNFSPVQSHLKNVHDEIVAAKAIPNPPTGKRARKKNGKAASINPRSGPVAMVLAASTSSTVKVEAEAG